MKDKDKKSNSAIKPSVESENSEVYEVLEGSPIFLTKDILNRLPVVVLEEAVAVPNILQQLPQTVKDNDKIISNAIENGFPVVVVFRSSVDEKNPSKYLSKVGVAGKIIRYENLNGSEEIPIILFQGDKRVKIKEYLVDSDNSIYARCIKFPFTIDINPDEGKLLLSEMLPLYDRIMQLSGHSELPSLEEISKEYPLLSTFYYAYFSAPVDPEDKDKILGFKYISEMMKCFIVEMNRAEQSMLLRADLRSRVQKEMEDSNRENFLRQEISIIREELGELDSDDPEEYSKRASKKKWDSHTSRHFERELRKLQRFPSNTPDYSIQATYLDNFLSLPWREYSDSDFNFDKVIEILDRDHFGLEKVKERILEQMAIAKLRADNKAPILCFVGPPGVGKTSLGKSIAEAMGREYTRVSFGGMHDEAEIRGHRRTYIGAMPGRILASLMKIKYSNPIMVLDEIDKIGNDFKGDPSCALLEVLDPEQNSHFHDNYLDADYDLSNVFFIATANSLEKVSGPLLDRMEIISIPGYISAEKVEIAKNHLIPKQLSSSGFKDEIIEFDREALFYVIDYYTRESGVRQLEKMIAKILRKIAVKKVRNLDYPTFIDKKTVYELLGKEEFSPESYENNDSIGVVTGLAWTSVGGEILFIESSVTEGKGKLTLTGNLGDVMKESATLALQYLRSHAIDLGLNIENFEKSNVHIHVPEGAIPKDGPSAGITMATSLASAFTGRKIRPKIAMTGEITLRGKVLAVGGIKEKIIAAKRAGINEIILSQENKKDIEEISERYLEGLTFKYVRSIDEVLEYTLLT